MKKVFLIILTILLTINSGTQSAKEILIYADSINYDSNNNLIAKGNAKVISNNEIITSDLIIINNDSKDVILPTEFRFKDEDNNYYYGSSGNFTKNLEDAEIKDLKLILNDGTRIVGKEALKKGNVDLINKGVYSPCKSKIKVDNFVCPLWQIEGEKILHDRENLFLHQKHTKLRILNVPVLYLPYLVTPSPLRKKRKSGFLNPSVNFNFFDTKTSQSTALPYYFAISQDKELTFTPTINYGGGVDASQKLSFDYNQLLSGGNFNIDLTTDTNFENDNNEDWVRDSSIITNYNKNINENYNIIIKSAFQTSPTYIRRSDEKNIINRESSLSTTLDLNGYRLVNDKDELNINLSSYQVVKKDEDNKKSPTVLPYINYTYGPSEYEDIYYQNYLQFYNIVREQGTTDHAQQQQKISHKIITDKEYYNFNSKLNFKTELHSQLFNVENKKIDNIDNNNTYSRFFPMSGLFIETPLKHKNSDIYITPKVSFIINSSQSNSNKISNELSTNNSYDQLNFVNLNRYTSDDKLDNSKRINYGFNVNKNKYNFDVLQAYEFQKNSNYRKEMGDDDYLSDLLGAVKYSDTKSNAEYNIRFNNDQGKINKQSFLLTNENNIGLFKLDYILQRQETNSILVDGSETLSLNYNSNKFLQYSKVNMTSKFDLIKEDPTNYTLGYNYFDECFGLSIDFERSFYEDRDLEPKDTLTLLFSFKNLGSYKSSNIAVSEKDKKDINWKSETLKNELFN